MDNIKRDQLREQNDQRKDTGKDERNTEGSVRRINKTTDDLDEKSSASGIAGRGSSSGLTSKDGLTGSDYDGQVTR